MNIAIIDADLIGRKNHKCPNLACMKISGYFKTRGVYIKYLAEKPNKHNVRKKTFEEIWAEIRNTVYEYSIRNDAVSENFFKEQVK